MKSTRRQSRKEAQAVEDGNEKKPTALKKTLKSATKDARKQKRKTVPVRSRKRNQKSEGGSESILSRKDVKVFPSDTSELIGGKLSEGRNYCSETTIGTPSEPQQLQPSEKIKLQLFPINESTRLRLEKDGYNPFLELTLSTKKRIWSVIKHINTKWGNENGKLGETFLFPYDINLENLTSYRRWSLEHTGISAAEVYKSLDCPAVFRLRYGWFSDHQLKSYKMPLLCANFDTGKQSAVSVPNLDIEVSPMKESKIENKDAENVICTDEASHAVKQQVPSVEQVESVGNQLKADDIHAELVPWEDNLTNISIGGLLTEVSLLGKINHGTEVPLHGGQNSEKELDEQRLRVVSSVNTERLPTLHGETHNYSLNPPPQESEMLRAKASEGCQPQFLWDEGATTLSIGGLFSEASMQGKINNFGGNKSSFPLSSSTAADSFDAFVAAQLNSLPPVPKLTLHESRPSIFDAEETCHAFPVRSGTAMSAASGSSLKSEDVQKPRASVLQPSQGILEEDNICSLGLKGINWNESLGPFDLGQPVCLPLK